MKQIVRSILFLVFATTLNAIAFGQTTQQQRNVVVNGQNGKAEVIDQNGRLFVDVHGPGQRRQGFSEFQRARYRADASDAAQRWPTPRDLLLPPRRPRTVPHCPRNL